MKKLAAIAIAAALSSALALAEVPVRSERLVWSVLAYNGVDYSPTFSPGPSDPIYLVAGEESFLSGRLTMLYWWPVTEEWKTDTDALNLLIPGVLEVTDGSGATRKYPLEKYTYYNARGEYELNWKVSTGDAAVAELAKYEAIDDEYQKRTQAFQAELEAYNKAIDALGNEAMARKAAGKDFSALIGRMQSMRKPEAPEQPKEYAVPPCGLQLGYVLSLKPGRYAIRLLTPEGSVLEGSERELVAHERSRRGAVGFEVIPSDRWTYPSLSQTPSSVIYVNGKADLYLRPFFEDEFNDYAYEKTIVNSARGNPSLMKWVRIQQVPHARVELGSAGRKAALEEKPFIVKQSEGSSLGYTIEPYGPSYAAKGKDPDLIAFPVKLDRDRLSVRALDAKGGALDGGSREIRIVRRPGPSLFGFALALLPIAAMAFVLIRRSRSLKERIR